MRRICTVFALGMAMCVIHHWDHTLASPVIGQEPPPRARPSVATPPNSQENQAVNDRLLKAVERSDQRARKHSCRTGFQEHSNPMAEDSSGRAVSSHHERGIQSRPWRELHPLPCRGRFLERRQAPEARRPRDGKNASHDQRATGKNGKPRNGGDSTFDQLRHLPSRRGQSAGGGPLERSSVQRDGRSQRR